MKTFLSFLNMIYAYLLRCYPLSYREEFEEQMLLDFSDIAIDTDRGGVYSLMLFCLRKSVDFPVHLLRAHFEDGRIFKILQSQPVSTGLRSALGFGIAFAIANRVSIFIVHNLAIVTRHQ